MLEVVVLSACAGQYSKLVTLFGLGDTQEEMKKFGNAGR